MPVRPEDLLEADEEIVIDPDITVRMIDESDDEQVPEVVPEATEESITPESVKDLIQTVTNITSATTVVKLLSVLVHLVYFSVQTIATVIGQPMSLAVILVLQL